MRNGLMELYLTSLTLLVVTVSHLVFFSEKSGTFHKIIRSNAKGSSDIDIIMSGIQLVESQTNANGIQYVKFVPRTTETSYLRIFSESGCWSYVI